MEVLDYLVLIGYFVLMAVIGYLCMKKVKVQEDYFMGGRGFGKLLQTFAAFGAGTGSSDPVNTARTSFTSGLSGMWSVMYWLFVTPFYWITGVWYRRMRHLTLGDWFVERYESRAMGAAYGVFGLVFFMVYGSMLFSAIGKVAAPLVGTGSIAIFGQIVGIEYLLVPVIGLVVLFYGILGGLQAAYWTDLIQGLCIILLSILLIPCGLAALIQKFGDPETQTLMDGFRIMHEQVPKEKFDIVGSGNTSEFPLHRVLAVVVINLVGIVVQPHFIATGGGSAKTENVARIGLVTGNFLKRFCTVGWAITALIILALMADNPVLVEDPDKTWGVASKEILGPAGFGLVGLMLACLLAALMSSIDAYMIIGSALVVRNIYAAYINPEANEKTCVRLGRITGSIVVGGAVVISLFMMDVFSQLQLTWIIPVLFAAPFWVGMWWRRATTRAAWWTIIYCAAVFFVIPKVAPLVIDGLDERPEYAITNNVVTTIKTRKAAPSDVARGRATIQLWKAEKARLEAEGRPLEELRPQPEPVELGQEIVESRTGGGKAIFWTRAVAVDDQGNPTPPRLEEISRVTEGNTTTITQKHLTRLRGEGGFKLDFLLYHWIGMDLTGRTDATLSTLELPPKIITPFLVMIVLSLLTRRNRKESLDRFYVKMKTPVLPDPREDARELQESYRNPDRFEKKKMFPGTDVEINMPTFVDAFGFVVCFAVCISVIYLAVWAAGIGSA